MNVSVKKVSVKAAVPVLALLAAPLLAGSVFAAPAMPAKSGAYQPYTKAAFDTAKGRQRVLFFHATWCPNCKRADADIRANLADLPAKVVVFKTDYDKEAALKRQYGITSQHTFVLVDARGKALKKWSGGGLREIVKATQTARQ